MNLTSVIYILIVALLGLPLPVQAGELIVNAVGDVMLAGRWAASIKSQGFDLPFSSVAGQLSQADITIANLESPIASGGNEFTGKKFRFRADPEVAAALKKSGINLVNLANNHTMDFGPEALSETLYHLNQAGVAWIGAGENLAEARQMALYTIKNKKIAFLGYSLTQPSAFYAGRNRPGTAPGFEKFIIEDITRARQHADYVIVSFHWGTEGSSEIQPYQRTIAHKAIEAGADVIIGHHPHVLRGIERYKTGIVFYSLGNFVFASKGTSADAGLIVRLRLSDAQREAELLPLDICHRRVGFQPQPLTGERASCVIERLNRLSKPFKTEIRHHGGRYVLNF
ncbi:MAG: CapA family protein [Geobacteraceae bacterium]|nr:CapA family protein [Geobacteraceae bacterium]